jgi:methyltransferase (TIGR00027 family)
MKPRKPSNTALIVAAGLQLARPAPATASVLPFDAIRRGADMLCAVSPCLAGLLRKTWFSGLCRTVERAILPGICLHFALRKRALRDHARAAIAAGCSQVLVLGAGLDTLCMELNDAYPDLCCIEIDHPATQAGKLAAAGARGKGIHYIGVDLAQHSLGSALAAHPEFRSDALTLFVAEGLLMYLPLDAVAALFAQMAAAAPDSWVAFTWLEPLADGTPNFKHRSYLIDFWLWLRGEPFLSCWPRSGLAQFLGRAGYVLDGVNDSADLLGAARRALPHQGLPAAGEYIGLARTDPDRHSGR